MGKFILGLLSCGCLSFSVAGAVQINGAGATFPYPVYSKWFSEYNKEFPNIRINYQSIGSGAGIKQFSTRTVDFGASDAPMKDDEITKAKDPLLHIPTVLGAVVLSYNLPGFRGDLKLTSELISSIFMGQISKWNDPRIQKVNSDISLPDLYITPVYRSDGSGTTAVFTDYLAKVSDPWKKTVGAGKAVKWPTGLGGKGNEGVTAMIKQTPGCIGYVEQVYALTNKLPTAMVQNNSGKFIKPTIQSVTAAAAPYIQSMPSDYRVSITNAQGLNSYPIAAFTYLLVYKNMSNPKGAALKEFLAWSMKKGQSYAEEMAYAPLPSELIPKILKDVAAIHTN